MLIDYVDIEKLPHWVVWLDYMFYAYKASFVVFMLIGFGLWIVYCLLKNGTAVG